MKGKSKFILIILLFFNTNTFSQGSWDINYVEIDSISNEHLGSKVKIDFKNLKLEKAISKYRYIRNYVIRQDTTQMVLAGENITLIEVRKIYTDHGAYKDQYLESINFKNGHLLRIYDSEILEIAKDKIKFKLKTLIYNIVNGQTVGEAIIRFENEWIEKDKLDGVMIELVERK